MNTESLVRTLMEQLRVAVGAALDAPVDATPASASGQVWSVGVTISGSARLTLAFEAAGAAALARAVGNGAEVDEDAVREAVRSTCRRAITAATSALSVVDGLAPEIDAPMLVDWAATGQSVVSRFACARLASPLVVIVALDTDLSLPAAGAAAAATPHTPERLDVLLDIDLRLVVRFGCTRLPLKTLSRLGPGSLIDLSRAPDDPVEMLVGDRVVARGVVVVVSGSYGVRVTEIVSGREVSRGLELR